MKLITELVFLATLLGVARDGTTQLLEMSPPLVGTWQAIAAEVNGREVSATDLRRVTVAFRKDMIRISPLRVISAQPRELNLVQLGLLQSPKDKSFSTEIIQDDPWLPFKIDASKSPHWIDVSSADYPDRIFFRGILELDDDSDLLTICWGRPRPVSLRTKPGDHHISMTYRRIVVPMTMKSLFDAFDLGGK